MPNASVVFPEPPLGFRMTTLFSLLVPAKSTNATPRVQKALNKIQRYHPGDYFVNLHLGWQASSRLELGSSATVSCVPKVNLHPFTPE